MHTQRDQKEIKPYSLSKTKIRQTLDHKRQTPVWGNDMCWVMWAGSLPVFKVKKKTNIQKHLENYLRFITA